jgi:hypothetical protein
VRADGRGVLVETWLERTGLKILRTVEMSGKNSLTLINLICLRKKLLAYV